MTKEELKENNGSQQEFQPDPSIKKYLMSIQTEKLIGIINACCRTNYPIESQVDFLNTEHFEILGTLDKKSVRGDMVANIQNEIEDNQGSQSKIVIELQSTKDTSMGFRMFIYSINVTDCDESAQTYKSPKALTIYTVLGKPRTGTGVVHMQIENFRVGERVYSAEHGDLLLTAEDDGGYRR